jgi:hypothetical protein
MVRFSRFPVLVLSLFFLEACASRMKDQMAAYREAYAAQDFAKALALLDGSELKEDKKSVLLWHLEKGTVAHALGNDDEAIAQFQTALELIDRLFTTKLGAKAASLLVNDSADEFYGASYERSLAHYYLAKSLYGRYQKRGNRLDLQGARATILAWDTYFTELQRGASSKTLYSTDLMLKVFGGQVHEASETRTDLQIALQLYKDALGILETQGGIFSVFNRTSTDYVRAFERDGKPSPKLFAATALRDDLRDFLQYKILALTKEVRGGDFEAQVKALAPKPEVVTRARGGAGNVVLVFEEGLIPQKVGKPFNFGIKGAINAVDNPGAKVFIASVGTEFVTAFAMNKLGMVPERTANPGSFVFAHNVTRLAVQEAAVEFELPMIEEVPLVQRRELFVLDDKGVVVDRRPLPIVSENGDIARVVLEEDVVARYVKTGTRVAIRHLVAIVAAMKVYRSLNRANTDGGDYLAKTAAMATYVGAAKGIAALEKADTRHWTTLPQALRMAELKLAPGKYQVALGTYSGEKAPLAPAKILGPLEVKSSGKSIFTFRLRE